MSVQTEINRISGEVSTQADLIAQIATALEGKAAGGSAEPTLQAKTVTPSVSAQTVTPDSGYDGLSQVTVNAMPTATQATPSISVSSGGLITASATQTAGYVASGTKSATKQLTTQAAQTITPGTSNKTIASGCYLTGTQTIKGDANLVAGNIKSGVSIFGVTGTLESGGGGACQIVQGTVTIPQTTTPTDNIASVTGLPFKPKFVVCFNSTATSVASNGPVHIGSGCAGDDVIGGYLRVATPRSVGSYYFSQNENFFVIRFTDDGFTVSAGSSISANVLISSGTYVYYAIG